MKRKMMAVLLIAIMSVISMTGFSSAAEHPLDGTWPEEPLKLAVEIYDTTDSTVLAYLSYFEYLSQFYNIKLFVSESIASAEQEHEFVSYCAAAGCNVYYAGYSVSGAALIDAVTGYGMYFISPDRVYDVDYVDNPYYLGGYNVASEGEPLGNGNFMIGYEIAYGLAKSDCKHVAYCNGGADFGVQIFIDVQEGFLAGIEAARNDGYDVAFDPENDTVRGFPGTDEFASRMAQILSADYDGIGVSFSALEVWAQPIMDAGKVGQIKLAGSGNVSDTIISIADMGMLATLIYQCEEVAFGNAIPIALNAITGHSDFIKGAEGYLPVDANIWIVDNVEDLANIHDKHESGEYYVTYEDIENLIVEFNPELTKNDFMEFYKSRTLENCLES